MSFQLFLKLISNTFNHCFKLTPFFDLAHLIILEHPYLGSNIIASFDTTYAHDDSLASVTSLSLLAGPKSPFSSQKIL
jgi:hypothetical protein